MSKSIGKPIITSKEKKLEKDILEASEWNRRMSKYRSDSYCPACNTPTVSKGMRQCNKCKVSLLWSHIDDGKLLDEALQYYWVWHMNVYGLTGWYPREWFTTHSWQDKY